MLPKELLVVSRRKGNVKPRFLGNLLLAEKIIDVFKKFLGKKYKELEQELVDMEQENENYKVIRGLKTLLMRNCELETNSALDCKEVRSFLFERGLVVDEEERNNILKEASIYFETSEEKVEDAIFSELIEEQVLKKVKFITPLELVKKYNLSLVQTLLFNALELTFSVEGNYQQIFRQVNYLGLIYEIEKDEIKITGPASLFKKTKKYGASLARIIPHVIKAGIWKIMAKIEMSWGNESRIYDFELNHDDDVLLPIYHDQIIPFDSEVEAQFYRDFKLHDMGWEIRREPTMIKAGKYVTIPDFGFYKHGLEVYLEVVGFWTPEYIKKKIKKLNDADVKVMVVVNENLNCKKEDFPGKVIFYKKRIPIKPIIKILKEIDENHVKKEMKTIRNLTLNEEIVLIKEKAKELNVSPEALERVDIANYIVIGNKFVSRKFFQKVKEGIGNERDYKKIEKILHEHGLTPNALDYMGYKVVWKGLTPIKILKK